MSKSCIMHGSESNMQKQPPEVFYVKRCPWKFHKIHRKTPVSERFPVNFAKFLRTPFLEHLWTSASYLATYFSA